MSTDFVFDAALAAVLRDEGGYVCDPRDPGGETNMGICKRDHPMEDIKGMTRERAAQIYRRDYWGPAGCDVVPAPLAPALFSAAVNIGPRMAVRVLQRACGAAADGALGPNTLLAISTMQIPHLRARFCAEWLAYYVSLPTWGVFGKGWTSRVLAHLKEV